MELNPRQTLILAILVLFLGRLCNKKIPVLRKYNIPEPVTGGVIVSLVTAALYALAGIEINFDLQLRDVLLLIFFTTIGLSAKIPELIKGGKALLTLFQRGFLGGCRSTSGGHIGGRG